MRLTFIYVTGFLLIVWNIPQEGFRRSRPRPPSRTPVLSKVYKNPRLAALAEGYVTGQKRGIGRKMRRKHRHLNLLHLFTPSGLHFSALLLFLSPLFKLLRLPLFPIYFTPFFFREYYAIKRIAEYKILRYLLNKKEWKIDGFWIFLGVFALDFAFGTYRASPLSYSFSYLFLGIIFSIKDSPKIYWPWALLGGQILAAYCFETPLTHLGFAFGFCLSALFALLFPIIALNRLLPWFNFSEMALEAFAWLVSLCAEISASSGFFHPEATLILLVFALSRGNLPRIIPTLLLLLTCPPLHNVPMYAVKNARKSGNLPFYEMSAVQRAAERGELPMWKHRMQVWRPSKFPLDNER